MTEQDNVMPGQEEATKLAAELKEHQKTLAAEFSKGVEKNADAIEALAKEMNEKIETINKFMDKKTGAGRVPGAEEEGDERKFSGGRFRKALFMRSERESAATVEACAPYEFEVCKAARDSWEKAMGTVPDASGGELVPMDVMPEIIESLRATMTLTALGMRTIGGLSRTPVHIRKVTGNTTAYWVGENPSTSVTASDMELGHISATPHRMAVRTTLSEDLMDFSEPAVESIANGDQGETMGLELDRVGYKGLGASNEPKGLDALGITVLTKTASGPAQYAVYEDMLAMRASLRNANAYNRPNAKFGWAMHPALLSNSIEKIKSEDTSSAAGAQVTRTVIEAPPPSLLLGHPFQTSTQLNGTDNTADLYYGNWNEYLMFMWGAVQMKVTDAVGEAAARFQKDLISTVRTDFGLRHTESIVKYNTLDI